MRRKAALSGALAGVLALVLTGAPPAAAAPAGAVTVTSARPEATAAVGQHFDYQARIVNESPAPTGQLLAHLNVASLTSDVYVDPEDWSSSRSTPVPALAAGAGTVLSWDLQAVSPGSFDVYVVILPTATASATPQRLFVSPPTHVRVTARRTLNAGGALPVVLAVPALLGVAALLTGRRRRRRLQQPQSERPGTGTASRSLQSSGARPDG